MRGGPNTLTPKPLDIFIVAEQFRYAGKFATLIPKLAAANPGWFDVASDLNMPTAAMVCAAFSLELYFKCLIRIGRKSYAGVHDLSKLFSIIGRRNRNKIKKYWNDHCQQVKTDVEQTFAEDGLSAPRVDFDYVLSASKDAFRTMRYIYEKGIDTHKGWLGDTIVEGARSAILEKHPEWENKRQISPMPKTSFQSINPVL
jgi:hypothetical protein